MNPQKVKLPASANFVLWATFITNLITMWFIVRNFTLL